MRQWVQAGLDADLLVVDGDVLEDATALQRPLLVVARGQLHDPRDLGLDAASRLAPGNQLEVGGAAPELGAYEAIDGLRQTGASSWERA